MVAVAVHSVGIVSDADSVMTVPKASHSKKPRIEPRRVVSLSQAHTLMIYRLGAASHIVGIDTFGSQPPAGFSEVPRIDSFAPDTDAVRSLNPTAVIASFGSQVDRLKAAKIGCPILLLNAPEGGDIEEQIFGQLRTVAELVEATDRVEGLIEKMQLRFSQMQAAAKPLAGRSFFLELDSELFTASSRAFLGHMFSVKLGLCNIADSLARADGDSQYFTVTREWLQMQNPHFYIVAHTGTEAVSTISGLDAVSSRRVVRTPVHYDQVAWSPDLLNLIEKSLEQMLEHQKTASLNPLTHSYQPSNLTEVFREALSFDGFDLVKPFCVGWYNEVLTKLGSAARFKEGLGSSSLRSLPDFGHGSTCLALIVGNSRSVWTPFIVWMRGAPSRLELKNPFDTFVHEVIERACGKLLAGVSHEIFWSCEETIDRMVAMQRVAEAAGMAELDHCTHLCVHPTYGTWISLRAVIVCNLPAADILQPEPQRSLLSGVEKERAIVAMKQALEAHENPKSLCEDLHGGGLESCERSMDIWRRWVALRDIVEVGKEYRFCQAQIDYHYTKDREQLRNIVLGNSKDGRHDEQARVASA